MDFKQPNILFLRGIHIDDILDVEDLYHKELLNNVNSKTTDMNNSNDIIYDTIPNKFVNLNNWKKQTNLRCWFCTLKFKNTPWFIIENVNFTNSGKVYDIKGNFCSVGCLQAFVNVHYNKRTHFDIYNSIKKLYKKFYNKTINEIMPSLDKYHLKIYGGKLDIGEYQKEIRLINNINISNGK